MQATVIANKILGLVDDSARLQSLCKKHYSFDVLAKGEMDITHYDKALLILRYQDIFDTDDNGTPQNKIIPDEKRSFVDALVNKYFEDRSAGRLTSL